MLYPDVWLKVFFLKLEPSLPYSADISEVFPHASYSLPPRSSPWGAPVLLRESHWQAGETVLSEGGNGMSASHNPVSLCLYLTMRCMLVISHTAV